MPPPDQKYSLKSTGNSSVWSGKRQGAFYRSEKLSLLLIIHDLLLFFAGIINQMERILCCFNTHLEIPIFFRSFPIFKVGSLEKSAIFPNVVLFTTIFLIFLWQILDKNIFPPPKQNKYFSLITTSKLTSWQGEVIRKSNRIGGLSSGARVEILLKWTQVGGLESALWVELPGVSFVLRRMLMLILQFERLLAQGTLMQSDKASSLNIQKENISPRDGTCLCKTSHTMHVQIWTVGNLWSY